MTVNHNIYNPSLDKAQENLIELYIKILFEEKATDAPYIKEIIETIRIYAYEKVKAEGGGYMYYQNSIKEKLLKKFLAAQNAPKQTTFKSLRKEKEKQKFIEMLMGIKNKQSKDEMDSGLAKVILLEVVLGKKTRFGPQKKSDFESELHSDTVIQVNEYARDVSNRICGSNKYEEKLTDWVYRKIFELNINDKDLLKDDMGKLDHYTEKVKGEITKERNRIEKDAKFSSPKETPNQTKPVIPASTQTIIIKEAPPPPPPRKRYRQ